MAQQSSKVCSSGTYVSSLRGLLSRSLRHSQHSIISDSDGMGLAFTGSLRPTCCSYGGLVSGAVGQSVQSEVLNHLFRASVGACLSR